MGRASSRKARRKVWLRTGLVEARTCPVCHAVLDAATELSFDAPPKGAHRLTEQAVIVCAYCGVVLVVEGAGARLMTREEWATLDPDQQQLLSGWPR
jgi:hypothetical protein